METVEKTQDTPELICHRCGRVIEPTEPWCRCRLEIAGDQPLTENEIDAIWRKQRYADE